MPGQGAQTMGQQFIARQARSPIFVDEKFPGKRAGLPRRRWRRASGRHQVRLVALASGKSSTYPSDKQAESKQD
jgi:hypothetical protein